MEEVTTAVAAAAHERHIVYIGMRQIKYKLLPSFYVSNSEGVPEDRTQAQVLADNEAHAYWLKPFKDLAYISIGSVYLQTPTDGESWTLPRSAVGKCTVPDYVTLWTIRERSHRAATERLKMQASDKYKTSQDALSGLDFFRAEYARALPARKVAILADVIAYVTRAERKG